ncbi:MAG: hypothetical protein RLZZ210_70 [Pseudomonadota bacterium]|jgi:hypothetical protein
MWLCSRCKETENLNVIERVPLPKFFNMTKWLGLDLSKTTNTVYLCDNHNIAKSGMFINETDYPLIHKVGFKEKSDS